MGLVASHWNWSIKRSVEHYPRKTSAEAGSGCHGQHICLWRLRNSKTRLRRLWKCGAFSVSESGQSSFFHLHARRHSPTLFCAFYKAFLTDPIGSGQELTLRATIALLGNVSSRQLLFHVHLISLKRESTWDVWFHVKMWQSIRNVLQVTWRRCYNVSGTSCKLLDEDVTT